MADVFWVDGLFPGRVGVSERPRGGVHLQDEMDRLAALGVNLLVSALEPAELEECGLAEAGALAGKSNIDFRWIPIRNLSTPLREEIIHELRDLASEVKTGANVAVHCYGGIGRSPLIVSSVLVLLGLTAEDAWSRVERARGRLVPDTLLQRAWVHELESSLVRGS